MTKKIRGNNVLYKAKMKFKLTTPARKYLGRGESCDDNPLYSGLEGTVTVMGADSRYYHPISLIITASFPSKDHVNEIYETGAALITKGIENYKRAINDCYYKIVLLKRT